MHDEEVTVNTEIKRAIIIAALTAEIVIFVEVLKISEFCVEAHILRFEYT